MITYMVVSVLDVLNQSDWENCSW